MTETLLANLYKMIDRIDEEVEFESLQYTLAKEAFEKALAKFLEIDNKYYLAKVGEAKRTLEVK